MIARVLMIPAAAFSMACAAASSSGDPRWLVGDFHAAAVTQLRQQDAWGVLGDRSLKPVNASLARTLMGDAALAEAAYYYLARGRYVGTRDAAEGAPSGISWSVDVDSERVAHVTSFRLSREQGTVETVVLISTSLPLEGVVTTSQAAE